MVDPLERAFFLENGYLHARGVLDGDLLAQAREEFERIWDAEGRANQLVLLKHPTFIGLIEHPPILDRQAAIFGRQTQLLPFVTQSDAPQSRIHLAAAGVASGLQLSR